MCHLSVQLHSSAGQTMRPDCGRQKGSRHGRFAAVSRSLWCHGADVTEAWFFSLQPEQDREDQRWLIIHSSIQVDPTESENTHKVFGKVTTTSSTSHVLKYALIFLQWSLVSSRRQKSVIFFHNIFSLICLVKDLLVTLLFDNKSFWPAWWSSKGQVSEERNWRYREQSNVWGFQDNSRYQTFNLQFLAAWCSAD